MRERLEQRADNGPCKNTRPRSFADCSDAKADGTRGKTRGGRRSPLPFSTPRELPSGIIGREETYPATLEERETAHSSREEKLAGEKKRSLTFRPLPQRNLWAGL